VISPAASFLLGNGAVLAAADWEAVTQTAGVAAPGDFYRHFSGI